MPLALFLQCRGMLLWSSALGAAKLVTPSKSAIVLGIVGIVVVTAMEGQTAVVLMISASRVKTAKCTWVTCSSTGASVLLSNITNRILETLTRG